MTPLILLFTFVVVVVNVVILFERFQVQALTCQFLQVILSRNITIENKRREKKIKYAILVHFVILLIVF